MGFPACFFNGFSNAEYAHKGFSNHRSYTMNEINNVEIQDVSGGTLGAFLLYCMTGKINGIQF